jgi:hypothetical protein
MDIKALTRPSTLLPVLASAGLLGFGLAGKLNAGWGVRITACCGNHPGLWRHYFFVFNFTHRFDTASLRAGFMSMFRIGGWSYVLAVSALCGLYINDTAAGRMEAKWGYFRSCCPRRHHLC